MPGRSFVVVSGPVARRRASGTITTRRSGVGGAQAVFDQRELSELRVQAAELVVGLAGGGEYPAHRAQVVDHGGRGRRRRSMVEVQRNAFRDRDAGVLDASVRGQDHGSGGGDPGLVAVADQPCEPVVGESGGGRLHEEEVFGGRGGGPRRPGRRRDRRRGWSERWPRGSRGRPRRRARRLRRRAPRARRQARRSRLGCGWASHEAAASVSPRRSSIASTRSTLVEGGTRWTMR